MIGAMGKLAPKLESKKLRKVTCNRAKKSKKSYFKHYFTLHITSITMETYSNVNG